MSNQQKNNTNSSSSDDAKKPTVDPWQLRQWGRQAAMLYVNDGTPLTDAVVQVLAGKDVTVSHIKRVCEEANIKAFQVLFSRGGRNRSVVFQGGPADPVAVLSELKDGYAEPAIQEDVMSKTAMLTDAGQPARRPDEAHGPPVGDGISKLASYLQGGSDAGSKPTLTKIASELSPTDAGRLRQLLDVVGNRMQRARFELDRHLYKMAELISSHPDTAEALGAVVKTAADSHGQLVAGVLVEELCRQTGMDKTAEVKMPRGVLNPRHELVKEALLAAEAAKEMLVAARAGQVIRQEFNRILHEDQLRQNL